MTVATRTSNKTDRWVDVLATTVPHVRSSKCPRNGEVVRCIKDFFAKGTRPSGETVLEGPTGATAAITPELRTLVYRRAAEMIRTCVWGVIDKSKGFARLRGSPKEATRPLLEAFDAKLASLVFDPATGHATSNTAEEAAVGLVGRMGGVIAGPITRDATGLAEFIGIEDVHWDVKSPMSPRTDQHWTFDAGHQVEVVRKNIGEGESILLNLSRCTEEDARNVVTLIRRALSREELQFLYVLLPIVAVGGVRESSSSANNHPLLNH